MNNISKLSVAISMLLSPAVVIGQFKNAKTVTTTILGNCEMCKTAIEKAGNIKNVASVEWNKNTKTATLVYNEDKTSEDDILKSIALAGYDSEKFLAPDDVYAHLDGCCKYKRILKPAATTMKENPADMHNGQSGHDHTAMVSASATSQNQSTLKSVFATYFEIKNALVKTDATQSAAKAAALVKAAESVDMQKFSDREHTVWMKVEKTITANAVTISKSKDIAQQRETFASLSENIYKLAKASQQTTPLYYQHCPMYNNGKGAHWLSSEHAVKNPYYGSQMLTCGSTIETIQ